MLLGVSCLEVWSMRLDRAREQLPGWHLSVCVFCQRVH